MSEHHFRRMFSALAGMSVSEYVRRRRMAALQELWPKAFREWFPANPYQSVPGPEIVLTEYADDDQTHGRYELWIPVEKDTHL